MSRVQKQKEERAVRYLSRSSRRSGPVEAAKFEKSNEGGRKKKLSKKSKKMFPEDMDSQDPLLSGEAAVNGDALGEPVDGTSPTVGAHNENPGGAILDERVEIERKSSMSGAAEEDGSAECASLSTDDAVAVGVSEGQSSHSRVWPAKNALNDPVELEGLVSSMGRQLNNPYERFEEERPVPASPGCLGFGIPAFHCIGKRSFVAICVVMVAVVFVVSAVASFELLQDAQAQNGTEPNPPPEPAPPTTPRPTPSPKPHRASTTAKPNVRKWSLNLRDFSCGVRIDVKVVCRSEAREICVSMKLWTGARPDVVVAIRTNTLNVTECFGFENFEEI